MTQGIESSSITETQEIPSGGRAGMAETDTCHTGVGATQYG